MNENVDDASRGLFASGSPAVSILRAVLLTLLAYAVMGVVAGIVWEAIWTPPGQVIAKHQVFFDSYASLRGVFTGTGWYVLVGGVASALVSQFPEERVGRTTWSNWIDRLPPPRMKSNDIASEGSNPLRKLICNVPAKVPLPVMSSRS